MCWKGGVGFLMILLPIWKRGRDKENQLLQILSTVNGLKIILKCDHVKGPSCESAGLIALTP